MTKASLRTSPLLVMASKGEETSDHDLESPAKFFWYAEDKNGNFTLRRGPPGNLIESRGPEPLYKRQAAVDGDLDKDHKEPGARPESDEGEALELNADSEEGNIANPLMPTTLKRKDDHSDHEARVSEPSTSHHSATLQQSIACKRRKTAHIESEIGETPEYDKSPSEYGGLTEYGPPSEFSEPSEQGEISKYDQVLNPDSESVDPGPTEEAHASTSQSSPQPEIPEEEGSDQNEESSIFSSGFSFNTFQSTQPENYQQDIQQNTHRRESTRVSPFYVAQSDDENEGSVDEELNLSTPIALVHGMYYPHLL